MRIPFLPSATPLLTLAAIVAAPVHGQETGQAIENITVVQNADSTTARFKLAAPLARMPTLFSMDSPPRLVIDFKGIGEARRRSFSFDASLVTAATMVGASDRTRVEIGRAHV